MVRGFMVCMIGAYGYGIWGALGGLSFSAFRRFITIF